MVNFNYTNTFERLYGWRGTPMIISDGQIQAHLNSVIHIHGTTRENMILGVDNISQMGCLDKTSNLSEIKNCLLKPIANKNTRTLRDEECAKRILNANIICIFGMSLGETDLTWWRLVGKRLQDPDVMVIIFSSNESIPNIRKYTDIGFREDKIKKLFSVAGITNDLFLKLVDKVSIEVNSDIFDDFRGIATYSKTNYL